jgi:uncharacterized protein (DUF433 family)
MAAEYDPSKMKSQRNPCFTGTRVPIDTVLASLDRGVARRSCASRSGS